MWKIHPAMDRNLARRSGAPRCAREITKAVYRNHHCLFERTDMKGGGQMCHMMLDPVQRRAEALAGECPWDQFRNPCAVMAVAPPRVDQPRLRSVIQQIA